MAQSLIYSFAPIALPDAKVLILGSMPGIASLKAGQYYAHPRNLFWSIMGDVLGFESDVSYEARVCALTDRRIALWDVLKSCKRQGSLDSAIEEEIPNDILEFLDNHPQITHIFLNGGKAQSAFNRYFKSFSSHIAVVRLPSTSPANASISYQQKRREWQKLSDAIKN